MVARFKYMRQFFVNAETACREAAANAFGKCKYIRFNAGMHIGKPLAGSANAGLNFVKNQHNRSRIAIGNFSSRPLTPLLSSGAFLLHPVSCFLKRKTAFEYSITAHKSRFNESGVLYIERRTDCRILIQNHNTSLASSLATKMQTCQLVFIF